MAAPIANKISQIVIKQIGKRLSKHAAKKASSRMVGHISRGSRAWSKAFQHIRSHFNPMKGKPSHAVFSKKYRSETAIKQLVRQAASKPSRAPITTKLTVGAENIGRPAVILERQFKHAIGQIGDDACHILRIVIDYTGRPITAYPVKNFVTATTSGAGKKTVAAAAVAVAGTAKTASAKTPVDIYTELLSEERAEQNGRSENICEPDGVVEWVIDFLVAPSCIAPDPHQLISVDELNKRIGKLTANFSRRIDAQLDSTTKANIRIDVIGVWGMGYRMN